MMNFMAEKFNIVIDGSWNTNEIIAAVIAASVVLLILWIIIRLVGKVIAAMNPRKNTIFSHRKNKYKNRIGKKVKY